MLPMEVSFPNEVISVLLSITSKSDSVTFEKLSEDIKVSFKDWLIESVVLNSISSKSVSFEIISIIKVSF